jgi:hypothetical protein
MFSVPSGGNLQPRLDSAREVSEADVQRLVKSALDESNKKGP